MILYRMKCIRVLCIIFLFRFPIEKLLFDLQLNCCISTSTKKKNVAENSKISHSVDNYVLYRSMWFRH